MSLSIKLIRDNKNREQFYSNMIDNVKHRCYDFLQVLLTQLERRLPPSSQIFRGLSSLNPKKVLSQAERLPFNQLPFRHIMGENIDMIEMQYRRIQMQIWKDEELFGGKLPLDLVTFWSKIKSYQNGNEEKAYELLANYMLSCLSTTVSNAVC